MRLVIFLINSEEHELNKHLLAKYISVNACVVKKKILLVKY